MQTISAENLRHFSIAAFQAAGFSDEDAMLGSDVLIWASLRGVDTHGIRNLKRYYVDSVGGVGQRDGVIITDAEMTVDHETDTTATLNANGGLGLSMSVRAMRIAIDKARDQGMAMITVRNSTHFGAAGYYAHMAVEHDMIGFSSTGYLFPLGQEKAVVPFGGLIPMLSTNPIAMACPGNRHPSFLLDMATSVAPVNRIEMLQELGRSIPLGWALDAEHRPTTSPDDVHKCSPLGGATAFGGHKGYGLAVGSWILTGLLSGAWRTDPPTDRVLGADKTTKNGYAQEGVAHCFAAIRIDRFGDSHKFKEGMDAMIDIINHSEPADGFERVLVAGQKEQESERRRMKDGIPLPTSTLEDLTAVSEKFGVALELD